MHQLDVALWREVSVNFALISSNKKNHLKNCVLVANKRAVATRVDLHEEKIFMVNMVMTMTVVMMVMVIKITVDDNKNVSLLSKDFELR